MQINTCLSYNQGLTLELAIIKISQLFVNIKNYNKLVNNSD